MGGSSPPWLTISGGGLRGKAAGSHDTVYGDEEAMLDGAMQWSSHSWSFLRSEQSDPC